MFVLICLAEVCFKETLSDVSNAVQQCSEKSGSISCLYTCQNGYVFYGGDIRRTTNCSGMNVWNPSPYLESCLSKTTFLFKLIIQGFCQNMWFIKFYL